MNEVFDLTLSDYDYYTLDKHLDKRRKDYEIHEPLDGKIKVTFLTENSCSFDCIYFYKSREDVFNKIEKEQPLNLRYTYIKDFDITILNNYRKYTIKGLDASYSFWDGILSFESLLFIGDVSFYYAQFGDGDVYFDSLFENSNIEFDNCQFGKGELSFHEAQISNGDVSFDLTKFGEGNIDFYNSKFVKCNVSFDATYFNSNFLNFNLSQFSNSNLSVEMSQFHDSEILFYNTEFKNGYISFNDSLFSDCYFNFQTANLDNSIVSFDKAQLHTSYLSFLDSLVHKVIFHRNTFSHYVDLRFSHIDKLIIEDCIIEKTLKCANSSRFQRLSFLDSINFGQIFIEWTKNGVFRAINNGGKIVSDKKERPFTSEEKASQFRMLKENFHNIGYYDDEDKAYRAYMKFKTNSIKRCWMKIFGLIGGYGTQAWKVILAALAVIAGFGGVYTVPMQSVPTDISFSCSFFKGLYFSAITFLTIGYGDISPPNQSVALLAGIEGFLGLFLMSFFTVAVARKLLR